MSPKFSLLIFAAALGADLFVSPLFGYSVWLPYFSLAVFPALIMFSDTRMSLIIVGLQSISLWLFAGVNLGISVLSSGILFVLFVDVIRSTFHTTTWQSVAALSAALALSLFVLGLITHFFAPISYLTTRFAVGIAITAAASFIFGLIMQRRYA